MRPRTFYDALTAAAWWTIIAALVLWELPSILIGLARLLLDWAWIRGRRE